MKLICSLFITFLKIGAFTFGGGYAMIEMLKLHIKNVINLEEILDYIGTIPFQQLDVKSLEARKQKKLEEVEKCKRLKTSLYEDMKDGILTKEEYLELHEAYLKKAKEGEEIIRQIERDIALILEEKDDKHLCLIKYVLQITQGY